MISENSLLDRKRTPIIWPEKLNNFFNVKNLYLKLEGFCPTGNHKFWFAQIACKEYLKGNKYDGIAVASCGHYASSLAWLCLRLQIKTKLYVIKDSPITIPQSRTVGVDYGSCNYDEAVSNCLNFCKSSNYLNATPGSNLCKKFIRQYNSISYEIIDFLGDTPIVVFCPVGNGTTVAALHSGFRSMENLETTKRLIAVGIDRNSLFNLSVNLNSQTNWELEPISSNNPLDKTQAIRAIKESNGEFICVNKLSIYKSLILLSQLESIKCHFSSAVCIAGLKRILETKKISSYEKIVLILTTLYNYKVPYENRSSF